MTSLEAQALVAETAEIRAEMMTQLAAAKASMRAELDALKVSMRLEMEVQSTRPHPFIVAFTTKLFNP